MANGKREAATTATDLQLPGTGRMVLQVYRSDKRTYSQPPGMSLAHIKVKNQRELARLWRALEQIIDRREWTDDFISRVGRVTDTSVHV